MSSPSRSSSSSSSSCPIYLVSAEAATEAAAAGAGVVSRRGGAGAADMVSRRGGAGAEDVVSAVRHRPSRVDARQIAGGDIMSSCGDDYRAPMASATATSIPLTPTTAQQFFIVTLN